MNIDLDNFVEKIFTCSIKPKNTYNLQVDITNIKDLFEMLLMVFTKGMKILYGNNGVVVLKNISETQLYKMKDYFLSIGYKLNIQIYNEIEYASKNIIKYSNYNINNKTKLSELVLPFKSENIVYIISFDFI
jgi:hypothetical protein